MSTRVCLRVLAMKSKLNFGKFEMETVADVFAIGQEEYLAWAYYNASNISFNDEILDMLKCEKIEKPGRDEAKWREWQKARKEEFFSQLNEEQRMHAVVKRRSIKKKIAVAKAVRGRHYSTESKGKMQARNHGHIK